MVFVCSRILYSVADPASMNQLYALNHWIGLPDSWRGSGKFVRRRQKNFRENWSLCWVGGRFFGSSERWEQCIVSTEMRTVRLLKRWSDGHQFKLFWIKPACLPSICKRWDGWLQLFFFSNTCLRSGRVTIWVRNALSSRLCHSFAAWPSGVSHCSAIPPILSLVEDFDSPQLSEFMKSILEAYPIFDLDVRHVCSSLIALCRRHCLFSLAMCCLNEDVGFSGKRVMYAWCKSFWVTIIARG